MLVNAKQELGEPRVLKSVSKQVFGGRLLLTCPHFLRLHELFSKILPYGQMLFTRLSGRTLDQAIRGKRRIRIRLVLDGLETFSQNCLFYLRQSHIVLTVFEILPIEPSVACIVL